VKEELGKWYAYLVYELDADPQDYPTERTVLGVDVGVAIPVACSNGNHHQLPDGSRLEAKIKRYQRKVARQQKGSKRSKSTYLGIAKAKPKQRHIRHNWAHHVSKDLAKSRVVAFEDLNVAGMTKSAKGTPDKPGKHVKAKSGLNREILNKSWHRVVLLTAYKARETVLVDPKHTSQTCSHCGCVSLYHCGECGLKINADLNASINIAKRALEKCPQTDRDQYRIEVASGSGASGRGRSVLTRDSSDPPTYVLGLT
ncbi:MAG: transposase, partial [Pseudomonadales bacterium]|nr:transposase [Pseudomonadales bacterium]